MKSRQLIITGSGIALIGLSFVLSGVLGGMKEAPEMKAPPEIKKYVKTKPVSYTSIPTEVVAFGRVRTAESLDMIAEMSGRMTNGSVLIKEGQSFRKGDLLYKIDDTEARLNLQSQKSTFLKDLAAILPDLKVDFSESYPKWETYFESIDLQDPLPELPEYGSSKEKTFLATKNIFSSYYSIKSAEANLRKYRFYAPFDGAIAEVNLQSGSFVNPGNKIGKILRSNKMEIMVDVSADQIHWIEKGAPANVVADNGLEWKGNVTRIGDYINQNTQSINVHIALQSNKNKLYDGQYLEAKIPGKPVENGMILPRNAIFNGNEVFVLQDSLLKVQEIDIHKTNPEDVIFSGLASGTDVVVEPLINAHNNMKAYKLEEKKDIDLEKKSGSVAKAANN